MYEDIGNMPLPDDALLVSRLRSITSEEVITIVSTRIIFVLLQGLKNNIGNDLYLKITDFIRRVKPAHQLFDRSPPDPSFIASLRMHSKDLMLLSDNHPSYLAIRQRIIEIDNLLVLIQDNTSTSAIQIARTFGKLRDYYLQFIDKFRLSTKTEREAMLLENRAILRCAGLPCSYLTTHATQRILEKDPRTGGMKRVGLSGVHILHRYEQLYFKFLGRHSYDGELESDDDPGTAYAVKALHQLIDEKFRAIPSTCLVDIQYDDKHYPLQVSPGISGQAFSEWLGQCNVDSINRYSYTTLVVLSVLVSPRDGKANNYVVEDPRSNNWLASIDNDDAWGPSFLRLSYNDDAPVIGVKTILYCMPQIVEVLDQDFVSRFSKLEPAIITIQWLLSLQIQNIKYMRLKEESVFSDKQMEELAIPFKLIPGTAVKLYTDLCKIKKLMVHNKRLTHQDLLNEMQPLVGAYYHSVISKYPENDFIEIFNEHIYSSTDNAKNVLRDFLINHPEMENELVKCKIPIRCLSEELKKMRIQEVSEAIAEFLSTFDWSILSESDQYKLLGLLLNAAEIPILYFNNCSVLDDQQLKQFAFRIKQTEGATSYLHIKNCYRVTATSLQEVCSLCPHLILVINSMSWAYENWKYLLITYPTRIHTRLPCGTIYRLDLNRPDILHHVLRTNDNILLKACLELGANANSQDSDNNTPLHKAAEYGNADTISILIDSGAMCNARNSASSMPLDIACCYDQQQAVLTFLKQTNGVIRCHDPSKAIDLYLQSVSLNNDTFTPLLNFAKQMYQFGTDKIAQLIPSSVVTLNLQGTDLSDSDLAALLAHCPNLESVDLRDCEALTISGLKYLSSLLKVIQISYSQAVCYGLLDINNLSKLNNISIDNMRVEVVEANFMGVDLSDEQSDGLTDSLSLSESIKILNLHDTVLSTNQWKRLAIGIENNQSLEQLILVRCKINDESIKYIVNALLSSKSHISNVDLSQNNISQFGADSLNRLITNNKPKLNHIDLYGNPLGDIGISKLTESLIINTNLSYLSINDVGLTDRGMFNLAAAIKKNTGIIDLDIGYNGKITDIGINKLLEHLHDRHNSRLQIRIGGLSLSVTLISTLKNTCLGRFLFMGETNLYHDSSLELNLELEESSFLKNKM